MHAINDFSTNLYISIQFNFFIARPTGFTYGMARNNNSLNNMWTYPPSYMYIYPWIHYHNTLYLTWGKTEENILRLSLYPYHYNLVANIVISRRSFPRQTTQTDPMYSTCSINIMHVISRQSRGRLLETTLRCAPTKRLRVKLRHYYRRPLSTGGLFRWTPSETGSPNLCTITNPATILWTVCVRLAIT